MAKHRHKEHEHENEERWLLSYADMITLLMAFFVVLYAMSSVDSKKFEQLAISLSESLGPRQDSPIQVENMYPSARGGDERVRERREVDLLKPPDPPAEDPPEHGPSASEMRDQRMRKAEQIQTEVVERLMNQNAGGAIMVSVSEDFRSVSIRLAASLLFQPGSAEMEGEALPVLEDLAEILRPLALPVTIEGHTDDVPINTPQFQSNWQLSAARAANVLLYMQNQFGLSPQLLSASGYGEFRPLVANDTPENRARNRRVEFEVSVPDEPVVVEPGTGQEAAPLPAPQIPAAAI